MIGHLQPIGSVPKPEPVGARIEPVGIRTKLHQIFSHLQEAIALMKINSFTRLAEQCSLLNLGKISEVSCTCHNGSDLPMYNKYIQSFQKYGHYAASLVCRNSFHQGRSTVSYLEGGIFVFRGNFILRNTFKMCLGAVCFSKFLKIV